MAHKYEPFRYRYEPFGGILQLEAPSALVYVDKDFMRSLGYPESPLWDQPTDLLSAPTEAHFSLTNRCSAGCAHCYTDSRPDANEDDELGRQGAFEVLTKLARMRVFHVALGGGESTELPWLFEAGHVARGLGIVPNLTTNGFHITEDNAAEFRVFAQVNVSIDGVGEKYETHRKRGSFDRARRGLELLKKHGVRTGINCVVSRRNFDDLSEVFALGRRTRVSQLELLRYKPSGRAAAQSAQEFARNDLTDDQAWEFFPRVKWLARKYRTPLAIDCSLTPFLYCHNPDRELLDKYGVTGCHGGSMLVGIGADGQVSPCSFAPAEGRRADDISDWWKNEDTFFSFRNWAEAAVEPCRSCHYLELCRGGCHAVSRHVAGDVFEPDPGCPIVRDYRRGQTQTG
ncbi:radical SAM protein [bacterium]|nr:radical SAM protein [bacterium]